MTMPSPAAVADPTGHAARRARPTADAPCRKLRSGCVMVAFLRREKGTSKACALQYRKRHPFSSKGGIMSKQRVDKARRWMAGSLAAGRKGASVHPAGRPLGYAAGLLDRAAFLRPIAHRGLHDAGRGRIENTAPAFLAAVQAGYGIECDLQAARDGTPMVFHDKKLDRLVAASGPIAAHTPQDLARLRYKGSDTGILTFAQLLELVDGRAPLLVEVKINGRTPPAHFLDRIARQARAYEGPIALMSFNADVVATLAKLAPRVPRGPVIRSQQHGDGAPARSRAGGEQLPRRRRAPAARRARLDDAPRASPSPLQLDDPIAARARDGGPLRRRADLRDLRALRTCARRRLLLPLLPCKGARMRAAQMAGDPVSVGPLLELRRLPAAQRQLPDGAAGVEVAAAGRTDRVRHVALQHDALALGTRVGDGHCRQQGLGVGVQRRSVEVAREGYLDDAAQIHDRYSRDYVGDHREIVGDEEVGEAELVLQILQQVDHLRLDGDIEGGDRLVADDELGLHRQRAGDADPLPLPAGELVRVAAHVVGLQPDRLQELGHTVPELLPGPRQLVDDERLADDGADRHARIERGERVLEDDLHVPA